eukprot:COSAG01_NODE_3840_length_5646_cov_13.756805_2_plen_69_part_00
MKILHSCPLTISVILRGNEGKGEGRALPLGDMCWMNSGLCGVLANPLVSQEERVTTGCPTRHTPHMNS